MLAQVSSLGIELGGQRALDFGCGVGRLTQALAQHVDEVDGVDISPSMVAHAQQLNRWPHKCRYHVNCRSDLQVFPDDHFDFIYSSITLQHIEPSFAKLYIREFIRVLRPKGVAVFQVATPGLWRGLVPAPLVNAYRKLKYRGRAFICMFGLRESTLNRLLAEAYAAVLRSDRDGKPWQRWRSLRYFVTKPA